MKVKLESGKEVQLKELSIDERDELLDSVSWEGEGDIMMIDVEGKAVNVGNNIISFDLA